MVIEDIPKKDNSKEGDCHAKRHSCRQWEPFSLL